MGRKINPVPTIDRLVVNRSSDDVVAPIRTRFTGQTGLRLSRSLDERGFNDGHEWRGRFASRQTITAYPRSAALSLKSPDRDGKDDIKPEFL